MISVVVSARHGRRQDFESPCARQGTKPSWSKGTTRRSGRLHRTTALGRRFHLIAASHLIGKLGRFHNAGPINLHNGVQELRTNTGAAGGIVVTIRIITIRSGRGGISTETAFGNAAAVIVVIIVAFATVAVQALVASFRRVDRQLLCQMRGQVVHNHTATTSSPSRGFLLLLLLFLLLCILTRSLIQ